MSARVVDENGRATGWLRLAGYSFTAWAAALPLTAWWFNATVTNAIARLDMLNQSNIAAHEVFMHRLDILEERQSVVVRRQQDQDEKIAELQRLELQRMR